MKDVYPPMMMMMMMVFDTVLVCIELLREPRDIVGAGSLMEKYKIE